MAAIFGSQVLCKQDFSRINLLLQPPAVCRSKMSHRAHKCCMALRAASCPPKAVVARAPAKLLLLPPLKWPCKFAHDRLSQTRDRT